MTGKMMKAYIFKGKNQAEWSEKPIPEIGDYGALVRVTCVAPCTSDVHIIEAGAMPTLIGHALGHEGVGIVEKVGSKVESFKPGDRVIIPGSQSDWLDYRGVRHEQKFFNEKSSPYATADGVDGTFAEYNEIKFADMDLAKIPDNVSDEDAVMLTDMVATAFAGTEFMNIDYGDVVVVLGIGPVGLMGVAGVALKGAARIIAVGSRPATIEAARYYGATDIVDYKQGDVYQQIQELLGGVAVDSVLIASGGDASEQTNLGYKLVRKGGHIVSLPLWTNNATVDIDLSLTAGGNIDKHYHTCLVEGGRNVMERYLRLLQFGKLDTSKLITQRLYGWDKLEEGIDMMRKKGKDVIKPVIFVDEAK